LEAHALLSPYHEREFSQNEIKKTQAELIQADREAEALGTMTRHTRAYSHYQVIKNPYGARWNESIGLYYGSYTMRLMRTYLD
jgi:hypothetical protein